MNTENNNQRVTRRMARSESIRLQTENNERVTRSHVAKDGASGSGPNTKNQNLEKAKKKEPKQKCKVCKLKEKLLKVTPCPKAKAKIRKVNAYCPVCDDGGFDCKLCESIWISELVALEKIEDEIEMANVTKEMGLLDCHHNEEEDNEGEVPMLAPELPIEGSSKKMENTIDTTDRISTLPDFIVHHILSYLLDDYESRVRMSVLSKKWFALTTSFPLLHFHLDIHWPSQYFSDSLYSMEMFFRYLEYTVSRFCDQNVTSAHTLDFYADFVDRGQVQLFGRCLDLLVEKGLQVLVIDVAYSDENLPVLRLPNTLLSSSSLTSLTLITFELPSSLMVSVVQLKSLRLLSLLGVLIDEGVIEHLTKGCPLLEEIYIFGCSGFRTFCVKSHHNLRKVDIHGDYILDRIDVDAPNLKYFILDQETTFFLKDKATSMSLGSCKKLTTFYYRGAPSKKFNHLLSNFPFIENLLLIFSSPVDTLKLSHHFLKRLELQWDTSLEDIDLNAPNLLMFEYGYRPLGSLAMSRIDSSLAKGCMKCHAKKEDFDILLFQRLRRFLEKNRIFNVLELDIDLRLIDVEELKLIQSPPYEIEHVKLEHKYSIEESPVFVALVDAVMWCLRPRSLTFQGDYVSEIGDVIEYTYQKLLQQEDEGQTNIKSVLISSSKGEQHFSDLSSLLKALPFDELTSKITFIKEEVVQEAK